MHARRPRHPLGRRPTAAPAPPPPPGMRGGWVLQRPADRRGRCRPCHRLAGGEGVRQRGDRPGIRSSCHGVSQPPDAPHRPSGGRDAWRAPVPGRYDRATWTAGRRRQAGSPGAGSATSRAPRRRWRGGWPSSAATRPPSSGSRTRCWPVPTPTSLAGLTRLASGGPDLFRALHRTRLVATDRAGGGGVGRLNQHLGCAGRCPRPRRGYLGPARADLRAELLTWWWVRTPRPTPCMPSLPAWTTCWPTKAALLRDRRIATTGVRPRASCRASRPNWPISRTPPPRSALALARGEVREWESWSASACSPWARPAPAS